MTARPIVVGYDGSELSDQALRWAAQAAAVDQHPVEVLVASPLSLAAEAWSVDDESSLEAMEDVVERAEKQVVALGCGHAHVGLVHGDPREVLARASQDAQALVVGATGRGPVSRALVGSVSRHLAARASCPLVVVRPAVGHPSRIVVGLDDRWTCLPALDFALAHAERTGEPVHALHAVRSSGPRAVPRWVEETLDEGREAHPDVQLTLEVVTGQPASTLVDASEHASLVVVGARGPDSFTRRLLASTGQQVLHHARCSVAIVR